LVETKEPAYASWYDGTCAWVVAADPNITNGTGGKTGVPHRDASTNFWRLPAADGKAGSSPGLTINLGPGKPTASYFYMAKATFGGQDNWSFGPSSDHAGGLILSLFCDGSAHQLSDEIDKDVFMWLVTRADGEDVRSATN
jgi:hypothetical protein